MGVKDRPPKATVSSAKQGHATASQSDTDVPCRVNQMRRE